MGVRQCGIGLFMWAFVLTMAHAQSEGVIQLKNPSFEDMPQPSRVPVSWSDCGFFYESPPDIQPGSFGVNREAFHGETYLGLVVRKNSTWEGVSQRLGARMRAGQCYRFSMKLSRSPVLLSPVSEDDPMDSVNFITPALVQIFGGKNPCEGLQLLGQSEPVNHREWIQYTFIFRPERRFTHISIMAFFASSARYYGHVLIDDLSDLVPIPCDD